MMRCWTSMARHVAARAGLVAALCFTLGGPAGAAEPHPWQLGFQPSATPVHERLNALHDELLVIIFLIAAFVLGLLLYTMVRFHHARNPVPTRTTHAPVIEILWTVVPVLILVVIAIPSFKDRKSVV